MENASKALLMAGGMLVALILISLVVYVFASPKAVQQEIATRQKEEEIIAFNNQYEAYNKKVMRGLDIITLKNMAINNNKKNEFEQVEIEIEIKNDTIVNDGLDERLYVLSESNNALDDMDKDKENIFKSSRFFKCTGVSYSQNTGKVDGMKFIEITNTVIETDFDTRGNSTLDYTKVQYY